MAIAKKATKTTPTPHWHQITLNWGLQCKMDPMWLKQHHVTVKKHPAAANQLPQWSLASEVTRGHQELSLWLVREHLARAVIAHSQAADATGLGTPTPLGMIQQRHTHCHLSLYLNEQLLKHQLRLVQHRIWSSGWYEQGSSGGSKPSWSSWSHNAWKKC